MKLPLNLFTQITHWLDTKKVSKNNQQILGIQNQSKIINKQRQLDFKMFYIIRGNDIIKILLIKKKYIYI